MDRYLKEYVREVADGMDMKLTPAQVKEIVNKLECNDYVWEVLDNAIAETIEEVLGS